jgi:predicted signal transduction protein with EAL and GGDEF domain
VGQVDGRPHDRGRPLVLEHGQDEGLVELELIDRQPLHVDASIGIALCPQHATEAGALLQRADVAMYQAKATQGGWRMYAFESGGGGRSRLRTIEELRAAIEEDQLLLHYQPKVHTSDGTVAGVEALVRWRHPDQGLL